MFFKNKKLSHYFVNLSIGKIFFKELTNGLIINARVFSERQDGSLSNELYISYIEKHLIDLKNKKYVGLSPLDGEIIRKQLLVILKDNNLIIEEENVEQFTEEEKKWFNSRQGLDKNNVRGK